MAQLCKNFDQTRITEPGMTAVVYALPRRTSSELYRPRPFFEPVRPLSLGEHRVGPHGEPDDWTDLGHQT